MTMWTWRPKAVTAVLITATAALAPLTVGAISAPANAITASQPGITDFGELNDVWCAGPTYCLAVGPATPASVLWNGISWHSVPAPAATLNLTEISCTSKTFCMAIGTGSKSTPLIDRWNGKSWQSQSSAVIKTATMAAISCATGKTGPRCVTVGGRGGTLAWNGKSWRKVTLATPNGVTSAEMTSVSCATSTNCVGVGHYGKNFNDQHPLAVIWHGSSWRLLPTPPAVATAVSCAQPGHCVGVGAHTSVIWNGKTWRKTAVGGLNGIENLDHISCPTAKFCVAEAFEDAVSWNGTSWKLLPRTKIDGDSGLWCSGPKFCMDVGQQASRWNGTTWTPTPLSKLDQFATISCARSGDCVALGASNAAHFGNQATLAESWNGTTWRVLPSPQGSVQALSCTSATFCLAMQDTNPAPQKVQSWNGSKWTTLPSPSDKSELLTMSCSSPTNCVAVGVNTAAIWNGTSWRTTSTTPKGKDFFLDAVSCASDTMCMAAGVDSSTGGVLAEKWNGSSWSVSSDIPSDQAGQVPDQVSCPTTTFCMENTGTDTMSWDGTTWHKQSADISPEAVSSMACGSTTSCVIVEQITDPQTDDTTFAAQTWNGASWQASALAGHISALNSVSCSSGTSCIAVGRDTSALAMAQFWNGSTWKLLTPVSP
jgi:hypothetical protein